jgi:hypothetical protein
MRLILHGRIGIQIAAILKAPLVNEWSCFELLTADTKTNGAICTQHCRNSDIGIIRGSTIIAYSPLVKIITKSDLGSIGAQSLLVENRMQ